MSAVTDRREEEREDEAQRRAAFRVVALLNLEVRAEDGTPGTAFWRPHPDGGRVLVTTTEDLSTGGVHFGAPEALENGTRLEILLETDTHDLALAAEVVHSRSDRAGTSVGARFDTLHRSVVAQLERLIAAYQQRLVPRIGIGYRVRCKAGPSILDGTTRYCSPGGLTMTLYDPVKPGASIDCIVFFGVEQITLVGKVVFCRASATGPSCSVAVQLDDQPPRVAERWRAVLKDARTVL
jgi:hypothetical protein